MPVIRITSSDEFKRLLSALADDIVDAHIHSEMFIKLRDALASDTLVLAQSNTFWQLTLKAHHETAIGCLSRAFDQEPSALHLRNWLETIRANLHLFSEPEFRTRLKDNPFVDSLAATPRTPDAKTLDADIALCSDTDPVVQKLVAYRNTSVAHQSSKLAARGKTLPTNMVPTGVEFEWLLDRAESILNKYSELFAANIHFTKIIGHDDFQYVIKSVASEVERSRAERRLDSL